MAQPGLLDVRAEQYRQQFSPPNYAEMFAKSLMGSAAELVGLEKPLDVQTWERDHPVAGLVSSFGVPFGYYGAALKIGRMGKFGAAVDKVGTEWNPILRYGAQEAMRIAPFEATRLAGTAAVGGDMDEVALDALLGIGLSAGVGAGFGALEAAGKSVLRKWGQVYDGSQLAPVQVQARDLKRRMPTLKPEEMNSAAAQLKGWEKQILLDRPGNTKKLFPKGLESGDDRTIGRALFFPKVQGEHYIRTLTKGPVEKGNFLSRAELRSEMSQFDDLPDDWLHLVQYPRHVKAQSPKMVQKLDAALNREMKPVGNGAWITKEKEDGLYVLAKKGKSGDSYLAFKTDTPRAFVKDGGMLAKTEQRATFLRSPDAAEIALRKSSPTIESAAQFRQAVPIAVMAETINPRSAGAWAQNVGKAAAQFLGYGVDDGAASHLAGWFKQYISPSAYQFKNPAARYSFSGAKTLFEMSTARFTEAMVGTKQLEKEGLMWAVAKGAEPKGGVADLVKKLDDEDLEQLTSLWRKNEGIADAEAAGGSENLLNLLRNLDAEDAKQISEIKALQKITGRKEIDTRKNYFGIQRTYKGDFFVPVYHGKRLVGIGGGANPGGAQKEAHRIIAKAAESGKQWRTDGKAVRRGSGDNNLFSKLSLDDDDWKIVADARDLTVKEAREPSHFNERGKVELGYVGAEKAFTKEELQGTISRHWQQNYRYIAELAWRHEFDDLIRHIAHTEPNVGRQLEQRINDLAGIKNDFDRFSSKVVDDILAPFVGVNVASRAVRSLNEMQYHLNFGAGNVAFPMIQMGTFTQTVLPEVAFLQHGAHGKVAQYYTNWPIAGADGKPRTVYGLLDTWKLMGRSWKVLANPTKALGPDADEYVGLLNELLRVGALEPRMAEEWIGPGASMAGNLRESIKSAGGTFDWVKRASAFAPNAAERLSRLHAATVAYDVGKNVAGFQGGQLATFMKEFTTRTMFGYNVADRSRVFTGPVGSAFGLFKNWQLHYIHMLMDYAGEGVARNNWKPLLWSFMGSASLGGAAATGGLVFAADQMSQLLANESLMELWYSQFERNNEEGANWSDALYLGLPAFLPPLLTGGLIPGVSFSGQASLPFSDPSRDISMLMSFVYWDRMKATMDFGEAVSSAQGNVFSNEQVQGTFLKAFAPKTVFRAQQVIGEGVINSSRTLYPTQSGLTRTEQIMYSLGFNPAAVELGYRTGDLLWKEQEKRLALTQALGNSWAEAEISGDYDGLDKIFKRALVEGVEFDKVMRSASARLSKAESSMVDRQFESQRVAGLRQSGLVR